MIGDPRSVVADLADRIGAEQVGPRCLVTGGAGYLASFLVEALLAAGCRVRVLDLRPSWSDRPEIDVRTGDVRDPEVVSAACADVDVVFHTAALIELVGVCRPELRRRVMGVNVDGTEAVIAACRLRGVGRLVFISSANVVIDREILEGDESERYAETFVDLYTESKGEAERRVLAADASDGLRTVALRPGGIWGPGEGGLMIRTFLEQLARGRFQAIVGDGSAVVDNTHVDNLVQACLLAAARLSDSAVTVGGRAYFVTDDERLNGVEWFRPLVEALGHPYPSTHLSGRLMYGVAYLMEWAHRLGAPTPPVTRIGVLKLVRSSSFRIDRARRELGYAPTVDRSSGLAAHLDDLRRLHDRLRGDDR